MPREQRLPTAWVARHGERRRYRPRSDRLRQWRKLDARLRYYGMHVIGFWPLWLIGFGIVAGILAAGYKPIQ